jgi:hypothetical protein
MRVARPDRVLCDRLGLLAYVGCRPSKVKIPTLPLQKTQGQGWGTLFHFFIETWTSYTSP